MLKPRNITRLREVVSVFIRYGFDDVLDTVDVLSWVGFRRRRRRKPEARQRARAEKLRLALEELGTAYIKLGQLLSTRPDILPPVFAEELATLQDRVESVPFPEIRKVVEGELGRPIEEVFERFEEKPVATASIAQVHKAWLRDAVDGELSEVAVKVVKPGVEELVKLDMEILLEFSERLSRSTLGRRHNFESLAKQLDTTLKAELDLSQEADNGRRLRESIASFTRLRIPQVVDELTHQRMIVMEYVHGTKLSELEGTHPELADELWRAYLKQILVDGAFQCDPHPGNFLLDREGRLALLDNGMFAYISRENQLRLMAILITLVERDGDRTARAAVELGLPGKDFREGRFRGEVSHLVARYSGVKLKDLPFGVIVRDLLTLCVRNDIQIPPEMVLFGKTLLNLEPMCRGLDPEMDPVSTMKDSAMHMLEKQIRRDISTERLMALLLEMRALLYDVPMSFRRILTQLANNELSVGVRVEKAEQMQLAIRDVANRITLGLITAALIMGSALLVRAGVGFHLFDVPVMAWLGFLLAAGVGLFVVFQILTGRH